MAFLKRRKIGIWLIIVVLLLPVCLAFGEKEALPAAEQRSQLVRVHLSRLGLKDRMDLTLASPYSMTTALGANLHFEAGSELALLLREDALYLYYQGMSLLAGGSLMLSRDDAQSGSGFYLTNYPALYPGDLSLSLAEGKVRPILTLHVEDYLLGVVPYEMSDSFPLEALKAQAVAARTYVLRRQNPDADYDVVDTTNDQVYKGYLPGNENAERAVQETRGVCGFYKGKLAQCYYSASNGGQTELVNTVWPTQEDFGYYAFGEDPYDLANPASVVKQIELQKRYAKGQDAPYVLRKLLAKELSETLLQHGYDPSPESVRVNEIMDVTVDTPITEGNKRVTRLHLTVSLSGRTRTMPPAPLVDTDTQEVSLFLIDGATPAPAVTQALQVTAEPTPEPTPVYGAFIPLENAITLDIPIFPNAETELGLDISGNYENEIWNVVESKNAYTIEARRYGHGVGMSQRGAQWMAASYGKNYQDILAFYYPGLTLMRYPEEGALYTTPNANLLATAGPAPSPTPRPTLMPATQEAVKGQWYAVVTEIDAESSLNLRSAPDLNSEVLMRLYKGQRLLVVEKCPEDGWLKVRTDAAEGYVMEKYLTAEK